MPDEGVTEWDDLVRGHVEFPNEQLEDVVLIRGDGRPTYNFASPMEDVWDGITHVIRAEDHISNTPKQINIIRAVGAELPQYAHVPNVNGADGKKLSKRHGATGVDEFRKAGYLPDALVNFLALLGWAPDGETTIMSRQELIERFSLERVTPSPAQFDYAKLDWMNGVYLRALPEEEFAHALIIWLGEEGYAWDAELVRKAAPLVQEKLSRLDEFPAYARFLFEDVRPDPAELNGGGEVVAAARDERGPDPGAQLGGRLARIRDHEHRLDVEPLLADRADEPLHEHGRLPRSRARGDEDAPAGVDGRGLLRVRREAHARVIRHIGHRSHQLGQSPPFGSCRTSPARMRSASV
jgi:glutamyl/glutaminyl-tRNA synthetase